MTVTMDLDELLRQLERARQSQPWRNRLLDRSSIRLDLAALRVLRAVERGSSGGDAPSIGQVAADLGVEHSTASRMVAAATRSELLTKVISEADQRRCQLTLTDRGRDILAEATINRRLMVDDVVEAWSSIELSQLVTLLERLVADFHKKGYR